ncbi:MAG TPA: hypothetical protein VMM77_02000 [Gemmatimonadaceae bacterium]|nr:hypothetical protein [Gemmatimonadaceae bacterium]
MIDPDTRNLGVAAGALLASSTTLVCCVLPAVLVSLGAGATLVSLVNAVPQLVFLSSHKLEVFGIAAALLVVCGAMLWWARRLPCPADARLARTCMRLRNVSMGLYGVSIGMFFLGATVAFLLPWIL